MIKDDVLRLWRQRPFQPFRIITVVGEAIDVWHPRLMLVAGNILTIGQPHADELPPVARNATWLQFDDIVSIEIITRRLPTRYRYPTPDEIPS